jgi:molecular chaperone HtpG
MPCVLTTSEYGWTANLQSLIKSQPGGGADHPMSSFMATKIMEINPTHEFIKKLNVNRGPITDKLINTMYYVALQSSGFPIEDPHVFSSQVLELMTNGLTGLNEPFDPTTEPVTQQNDENPDDNIINNDDDSESQNEELEPIPEDDESEKDSDNEKMEEITE